MPSGIGSAPSRCTAAAIIGPLELRVCPKAGVAAGGTSSLPVETIATRTRGGTSTCVAPASAASPISALPSAMPAESTSCPRRNAAPCLAMCCPTRNRSSRSRTLPPACTLAVPSTADSTGTTASAPAGIGAPVMIRPHAPRPIASVVTSPAARSTATSSSTISGTAAEKSSLRTAKPSIIARSQGGESTSDTIPAASTRPQASSRGKRRGGSGVAARSIREIASGSSIMPAPRGCQEIRAAGRSPPE